MDQDGAAMEKRRGWSVFWTAPPPVKKILGMVKCNGAIAVATDNGVYLIDQDGNILNGPTLDAEQHRLFLSEERYENHR